METCKTKAWAEIQLVHYATAIKAMEDDQGRPAAEFMGVKLKRYTEGRDEFWQVVLVDRREKESCT
jgi:hypothetical protein